MNANDGVQTISAGTRCSLGAVRGVSTGFSRSIATLHNFQIPSSSDGFASLQPIAHGNGACFIDAKRIEVELIMASCILDFFDCHAP